MGTDEASRQSLSQSPVLGRPGNKQRGARRWGRGARERQAGARLSLICSSHDTQPCGTLCASQTKGLSSCSAAPFLSHRPAPHTLTHRHKLLTHSTHRHTHTLTHPHTHTHKLFTHSTHTLTHTNSSHANKTHSSHPHTHTNPHTLLTHPLAHTLTHKHTNSSYTPHTTSHILTHRHTQAPHTLHTHTPSHTPHTPLQTHIPLHTNTNSSHTTHTHIPLHTHTLSHTHTHTLITHPYEHTYPCTQTQTPHTQTHPPTKTNTHTQSQSLQQHRHRKHGDPGAVLTHQAHGACENSPEAQLRSITGTSTHWEPLGHLEAP